ncbi:MAG: quinol dehydrogenase membrane component [Methanosaeta sp. PtaB.Bin039]|nr:MAG: quinol dehydrogenase membrane component [Methanosaeta sp. PtaB.Bin039]OPY44608.1 MAG: quinol dehydrogenase membrane component [Methanosaeta sp. PtaU1.Bin028]
MLKVTPYLGVLALIACVGGIWYPRLGYLVPVVFLAILISSPFRGRWFCGNLCPWGSFNDFFVSRITRGRPLPPVLSSMALRVPIFVLMMGFMMYRLLTIGGLVDQIGMVFVTMCTMNMAASLLLGTAISPRAWCNICPMGTAGRLLGYGKYKLKLDKAVCIDCGKCLKVCPMQLEVNRIVDQPDCLKCGRCVEACPKGALQF